VALSPDGGLVAVGHDDRVQLWDTATLRQRGPDLRAAVSGLILSLAFSPDGRYLAASSVGPAFDGDGLRIWAIPGGEVLHTLPGTELLAWRPDSGAVLASRVDVLGTGRSQLGAWEPGGGRRIGAVPAPEVVVGLAVSPDGRLVAVAGEHGAQVRRLADGAKVADLPGAQEPVFLADGTVAGNDASGRIRLWRPPSGRELPGLTAADENRIVTRLEATPEGTLLALGEAGVAESWAVPSGRRLGEFVGFRGTPTDIDVSADGKVVAVTGRGGATTLWRRDTAGLSHPDTVVDLAFDGRGRRLASASSDGAVRTWDVAGRRPTATMRQSGRSSGLAVAPDGTLAASAGDGTILVRDPGGRLVARLRIGASLTGGEVAFSPDGSLLASGGEDGAVILWPLDPAGAVQRICRVLATARPAEGLPVPDECR
jgi:WD40 repeat protein